MRKPIIVVGSINMDLVVAGQRLPDSGETLIGDSFATYHGGKGANQAYAVARLGYPVRMVGTVGDDGFGAELRRGLDAVGVDTALVDTVSEPSGVALITTGAAGENTIVVVPGANSALTPARLEACADELAGAAMLLAQLEIPLDCIEWLAAFAARAGIPFMLDPAPARDLPSSILRHVTWLTPNESETVALLGGKVPSSNAVGALMGSGVKNVVLKLSSSGCVVAEQGQPLVALDAVKVSAVDTTAAGDAFNAGFAVGLARGDQAVHAALFATRVAGLSVTRRGAQPSMPSADEVANLTPQIAQGAQ